MESIAPASSVEARGKRSAGGRGADGVSVTKRLQSELMAVMMSGDKTATAFPDGDNMLEWIATIVGSDGTVYEGLEYKLRMVFPADYPFSPPTITFITPCFHPNVDSCGRICLDILKENWSAAYSVRTVLLSLQSLLGEPNVDSPLNGVAAQLWERQDEYRDVLRRKYREATEGGTASAASKK